ncbi:hypothetical protein C7416_104441 [Cupriavidus phytorum]|uniref:Lipoprotein n=1 Tax=Cupriavidus phytorum TaxID=3024399 RepID=A0A2W7P2A4_9BURK|nr:hypothetical protein C7416_104441 [Cupriavidus alkaliphilus]
MRLLIGAAAALVLAGCATSSKTYGPNGEVAHSIGCSGTALSWGMCYEKAGEICGEKGYNVISTSGDTGSIAAGSATRQNASFVGGSTISRSMVIACKP